MAVDERRMRSRNDGPTLNGAVVYWMQRDQRVHDNWALLYAQEVALSRKVPLYVVFNLVPSFGKAILRHYDFMLRGLEEVAQTLEKYAIPFHLLQGDPKETIPAFVKKHSIGEVVVDQNPLRFTDAWREAVGKVLPVRLTEVDAHNIVPVWVASPKEEFAAYTFRPKVTRFLPEFLTEFPRLKKHPHEGVVGSAVAVEKLLATLDIDRSMRSIDWCVPGEKAAMRALSTFIDERLAGYATRRNDPTVEGQSDLSPYFHFGQLAPQRVALAVAASGAPKADRDAYLEELIVRRELSDNYCFYNAQYDKVAGAHAWAQATIAKHAHDEREYVYTKAQLDAGRTHDDLWNAMQMQLVHHGKLHGWCRMYWAKKILEWTKSAQVAIDIALYLNDRYSIDGNDPNGVVGVMWSIAGVHDRAWNERPVFGMIRYMNYAGAKRKFAIREYIERWGEARGQLFL